MRRSFLALGLLATFLSWLSTSPQAQAAKNRLTWDRQRERIAADITDLPLPSLLENVAAATGWQIFVEPDTTHLVSTKFADRSTGEALRLLLGDLSFALVPQKGAPDKLFVFRTSLQQATQSVKAKVETPEEPAAKPIPNQLIVRVKPGTDAEALAKALGAKIVGRIDGLNAYLFEFEDEQAANSARDKLRENPSVASIEPNYPVPARPTADPLAVSHTPPLSLRPKAVGASDRVIVGLIDTAIQKTGGILDQFVLETIKVADGNAPASELPSHATAMAETILRAVGLVLDGKDSSKVRILPVDVYGNRETTSTFDVANGIFKAINAGAMIINLSLGSSGNTLFLHEVIQSGRQQGVVFFASAGNEPVTTPVYPAAYPETTAVTAVDPGGNIAPYANRGDFIDAGAPGASLVDFNQHRYIVVGTSPAAASTSGFAAGYVDATGKSFLEAEKAVRRVMVTPPSISGKPK